MNHSPTTDFPSLCVEYISISFFSHDFIDLNKTHCVINPYFLWFSIRFFWSFLKSSSNCNNFFIFQRNNPSKFTININNTNKNLNPLLNLLINCTSAKSAPQILSIIGWCTFLLSNFLKLLCVVLRLII